MNILLNGQKRSIDDDIDLHTLIEQLELTGKRLAVEVNQDIIPKSEHAHYKIQHGDTIEIVFAIGGG